jgi:glyoxylate/hydroxypyruvate reductase A
VTPHVAAATRPATAALMVAENIARVEAGLPLLNAVDRARGY